MEPIPEALVEKTCQEVAGLALSEQRKK